MSLKSNNFAESLLNDYTLERVKGQSAIEYLMTYGWMLLVVAVVGGAIFSFTGDQSVESVNGFSGDELQVENFGLNNNEGLDIVLQNTASQTVEIKSVNLTDNGDYTEWRGSKNISVSETGVIELANVSDSEGSNNLDVKINYGIGALDNLEASGSITGGFEITESSSSIVVGEEDSSEPVAAPSVGGEWSLVEPAGAEGGYDYFFNSSTTPYGTTYGGNSSVQYTDDGFFVMKYQASNDSGVPVSNGDAGWNSIPFNDAGGSPNAYDACEALDSQTSDYDIHLTTNREWMTTARQVAQDSSNWADNTVGSTGSSGGLYQGNHDEGGSYDRAVNLGDYPEPASSGGSTERTLELASGDKVWDMSGDLWMWIDTDEDGTKMDKDSGSKIYERGAKSSTVGGGDGLGVDYGFDIDNSDAALRGGGWNGGDAAGVFTAYSGGPDVSYAGHGFRCSAVPVS